VRSIGKAFDYSFSNLNFWWYYVSYCYRGFDKKKEIVLDEAIREIIDCKRALPYLDDWYSEFCPEEEADDDGILPNPYGIEVELQAALRFAIAFHISETIYYFNDIYIGNHGGHFEAWFFTWDELLSFAHHKEEVFMLLSTMTGITNTQRPQAQELISQSLKKISIFAEHSDYIAECICRGLVMDSVFARLSGVGLTNSENHSVRNVEKYPRYRENVTLINQAIDLFEQQTSSQ
jgi:hypothetical protein